MLEGKNVRTRRHRRDNKLCLSCGIPLTDLTRVNCFPCAREQERRQTEYRQYKKRRDREIRRNQKREEVKREADERRTQAAEEDWSI